MNGPERYEMILQAVRERERVGVAVLAELTGCSEMTIRRDLDHLEREGCLRRVRGAAVNTLTSEVVPFALRAHQRVAVKKRIATAVAELVEDGESLVLDSGTTALEVAGNLVGKRLTVLPLSLHVVDVLRDVDGIRLVLPGGDVHRGELSLHGPLTRHALDLMRFDTAVLGCCGIDADNGVTAYDLAEAEIKHAAVRGSTRVIAAADSSKLGRTTMARVCALSEVDLVVTDTETPKELAGRIAAAGPEVRRV